MKQILLGLILFIVHNAYSQQLVKGTVTSKLDGTPIPYINVTLKNTKTGTVTDLDGSYSIKTSALEDILVFSSIGYITKEVETRNKTNINVILSESSTGLSEVVITALNKKRESKELGYAIQSIQQKDISEVKAVNFLDNLTGKLAGVSITSGSATGAGSSSKIVIRGEQSFTNNNPLFIVDGTPINNNTVFNFTNEAAAGFQEVDFGNGAMEVNSDDIESVSVLKGASAAALYGTRASNGVIIINTKKAKDKFSVSLNSSLFIDTAFQLPQFQNLYGQGNSGNFEFVDGLGAGINDNITYSWGPRLDQGALIPQFDSPVTLPNGTVVRGGDTSLYNSLPITPTPFVSNPDNLKNFYQTGITTINNIAIGSGFDKGNYRLSFTDLNSESIIPGVNLKRKTITTNLQFLPSDKTTVSAHVNYVNSNSDNRPSNGYGSENVNYSLVAWGPRSLNIDNLRNYWQPGLEGRQQYAFNYTFFDNPYFILHENRNEFNRDRLFGNISLKQQITKNLSATLRTGMDYSTERRRFLRNFSTNRFRNGAYAEHDVSYREINTDFLLNYTKKITDFDFDVSLGGNQLRQKATTKQTQTTQLAQPGIFSFNNAASPIETFDFSSEKRINSLYGLLKVGYKNTLFIDITGRNDWSSALATPFSAENTSFFYPSASTSLILNNLFQLPKAISFAKLRASIAQVGNDTNPYQTSRTFLPTTNVNSQPSFTSQNFIPNPNLKPEKTTSFEIGTDLRFFNDKLNFDITYYNALTEDQILSLPIPISSGFNQQVVNGGKVRSEGIEIVMNSTPVKTGNFKWNTTVNFSRNISTIESLPQNSGRVTLAYSRVYNNPDQTVWFQVEEGGRIGDFYGTGYLKNENGDFVLTPEGRFIADPTLKKLGNYNPDFTLGFNNEFNYKNWSLSFLFDWRQGGELVSRTLSLAGVGGQLEETAYRPEEGIVAQGVVNTGTAQNPIYTQNTTAVTPESYYRQFYDRNHEENNVYDASFLKLRQFSLGYTFHLKNNAFGFVKNGAKVNLSLIGRNLFAISDIPHFDPEQLAVQGQGIVGGVEDMSYASSRSFGFKLGVNF
ncbi:TonB-linked outer membrane protein, SusC/RagA family [Tenacibaculum sp. MAR_2009_124]|uniref:SusC/RagA family TonB-linked outer membrane protein n=1 Tax=Tenacibaculum sp. MAR_2009_124 TaxID=1250059 RepID=UPI0008968916|nr:SusC/RagA family TonB-linked outer membrane protein [Tenacibaculum sp. MAR_2009_124]SEC31870.1 TonB-linked outer membrane protein, SusC/RagA family [Tenacibaculum sp. MAR_2009_124]